MDSAAVSKNVPRVDANNLTSGVGLSEYVEGNLIVWIVIGAGYDGAICHDVIHVAVVNPCHFIPEPQWRRQVKNPPGPTVGRAGRVQYRSTLAVEVEIGMGWVKLSMQQQCRVIGRHSENVDVTPCRPRQRIAKQPAMKPYERCDAYCGG